MIAATFQDKLIVVQLLVDSFNANKSINYIVKQDSKRTERIKALMEYSFDVCLKHGSVFLSEKKDACALILFPDKKKPTLRTFIKDINIVINVSGLSAIPRILNREKKIKANYPNEPFLYLWFICVSPKQQGLGLGKHLLGEIINIAQRYKQRIYLETSMVENLIFYKNLGFEVYKEIDFGYRLYLLRKSI